MQVKRIAEELGVRYVLQGSVRRANERVRITTQLVDALTGSHVWAERYDRDLKDVFAIQDDLARKIVSNLAVRLTEGERGRLVRHNPSNPEAYDLYLRGRSKRIPPTAENLADARALFEQAIELDPRFSGGYVGLSTIHLLSFTNLPSDSPHEQLTTALRLAERAIELDPTFGPAHGSLANALIYNREFDDGLTAIRKAVELAPGDALMRGRYGRYLGFVGEAREGLEQLRIAQRMAPGSANVLFFLGLTYRAAGQYEKAIEFLEDFRSKLGGRILANADLQLAAAYMQAGREDDARAMVQAVNSAKPHFTLEFTSRAAPYKEQDDMAAFLDALRKAGLPK